MRVELCVHFRFNVNKMSNSMCRRVIFFIILLFPVPPGDEGWLCPICDCKIECLDAINDRLETDFDIEDSWEVYTHATS